jgi:hypothetical protein
LYHRSQKYGAEYEDSPHAEMKDGSMKALLYIGTHSSTALLCTLDLDVMKRPKILNLYLLLYYHLTNQISIIILQPIVDVKLFVFMIDFNSIAVIAN